jgi:spore germination cell wall hydrolase CwlJ-like protein
MRSIPFGLATMVSLMPTQIGYQDFIALLVRQPEVSQRARAHMMASPFGTIHAATFSFPQPVGTAIPPPPRVRLASLDFSNTGITGSVARDFTGTPMARSPVEFPVVNRRLKGDLLVTRPQPEPPSDGGGTRDLTPGRVKTVSFPRPSDPLPAPSPSAAAAPLRPDAVEHAVTSLESPEQEQAAVAEPVIDKADRVIEPAPESEPAAPPSPEIAAKPADAVTVAALPAAPSAPDAVVAAVPDNAAALVENKVAALPTDNAEVSAPGEAAASAPNKAVAPVADDVAAIPTDKAATPDQPDEAGLISARPTPDIAAPSDPAAAPPSPPAPIAKTAEEPAADPIDDGNTAVRLTWLYFGNHPVGKNIGPMEPWPEHQELHIQTPPAADPDIKRSAIEPTPTPTPEELKSGDVAPDSGETVARKGQVTGPGKRPKTPAERLGLDAKGRAKAERCLAEAVYFESRGEPKRGQVAVAQVVMNRVFSGFYPTNVCGVVYQNAHRKLACQFTFACDNVRDVISEPDMWQQAKQISRDMLDGKLWLAEVGHSTHYHAYWVHPSWVREMRKLDKIGVHKFYRPRAWGDGSDVPPLNESQMLLTPSEAATKAKL